MTAHQRITLMADWWPKACAAQGWNKNDRAIRMRVLSEAVGRPLESASDLDSTGDIDRVKAHLGMLADNVAATIEVLADGHHGKARRLRVKIREELLPCLGVYLECGEEEAMLDAAERYLTELIGDKFQRGARHESTRILTLDDLSAAPMGYGRASQLDQVVMTLARTVQSKRKAAGDSIHTMKLKAGLECDCRPCCDRRLAAKGRAERIEESPARSAEVEPETEEVGDPF